MARSETPQAIAVPTAEDRLARDVYLALIWSLAYPGRAHCISLMMNPLRRCAATMDASSLDGFVAIGKTLLDLETSFFCADPGLEAALRATGATPRPVEQADYVFLPQLDHRALELIARVRLGDLATPDDSATLICGAVFDVPGAILTWRGPGLPAPRRVMLGGVPDAFWSLRASMLNYPLGFDVFFVDRGEVIGLPRTTQVQQEEL